MVLIQLVSTRWSMVDNSLPFLCSRLWQGKEKLYEPRSEQRLHFAFGIRVPRPGVYHRTLQMP